MSEKPKHGAEIKENREIKDLWIDNYNHKFLGDNTDHRSVNKHSTASHLSATDKIFSIHVSRSQTIFPSTQVFTILSEQPCLQKQHSLKKKVTGTEAINACVPCRAPSLLTNGLGLRTKAAFYGALLARRPKCCHKSLFFLKSWLTADTQRLFCCAVHVIYNQTDGLREAATVDSCSANHINLSHSGCCEKCVQVRAKFGPLNFSMEENSWFISGLLTIKWN